MPTHTDDPIKALRRRPLNWIAMTLALGLIGSAAVASGVLLGAADEPREFLLNFRKLVPANIEAELPLLEPEQLTGSLRAKGFHECNPHDPIGLGPYTAYRNVRARGRMLIPQRGGHTDDLGFDVLIHFHGHEPVRKTLVQITRGISYVGIDLGIQSGPYMKAFQTPGTFKVLRQSIEQALRDKTADQRAHIRNLGLSAWSAGYGAVNEILKESDHGVDAVVLLDGLHAGYDPSVGATAGRDRPLSPANISPIVEFARQAKRGEKLFVFTHSKVDPVSYPSTAKTAGLILKELALESQPATKSGLPFALTARADHQGVHVWSYTGGDTKAHCEHIRFIAPIVRDIIEPRWETPPMDRDVPFTKAPQLGTPKASGAPKLSARMEATSNVESGG